MREVLAKSRPMTMAEKTRGLQVRAAAWQSSLVVGDRARGLVYEVTVEGVGAAVRQDLLAQVQALGVKDPTVAVATAGGLASALGDGARAVAEDGATAEATGVRTRAYAVGLATARAVGDEADASASGTGEPEQGAGVAYALAHGQHARAHALSRQGTQCIAYARTERSVSHAKAEGTGSRASALADRGLTAESSAYDGALVRAEAGCGHVYLEGRGSTTEVFADNWTDVPVTMVFDSGNHVWGLPG